MSDDFMSIVQDIGTIARSGSDLVGLIQKVRGLVGSNQHEAPNAPPSVRMLQFAAAGQQGGGRQHAAASFGAFGAQYGVPVPAAPPMAIGGIDLSGLWLAPGPQGLASVYLRQFGPYLNVVFGMNQMPTGIGEGVFNPMNGAVQLVGQFPQTGLRCEWVAQVQPNWTIVGQASVFDAFGLLQAQGVIGYTRVTAG